MNTIRLFNILHEGRLNPERKRYHLQNVVKDL